MQDDYKTRKAERIAYYKKYVHGNKLVRCVACNGSGKYDHFIRGRTPNCSSCKGTGKTRERE